MIITIPDYITEPYDEYKLWSEYGENALHPVFKRVWERKHLQTQLCEAQNHRCAWCGEPVNQIPNSRKKATIEHVIPKSLGGLDIDLNFVIACSRCNNKRSSEMSYRDIDVSEFKEWFNG